MVDSTQISEAEWQVMSVSCEKQPVDSQTVVASLSQTTDWSVATIKTMLHRLVKKGVLAFEKDGKRYLYRANLRRSDCVRQASRSFLDRVFGGHAAPAVLQLVKAARLSPKEVEELRRLLNDKEGEE